MKVLFMPLPGIGHTFPMVPFAWALRAAGHDVTFITGHDGAEVAKAGFAIYNPIPDMKIGDEFAGVSQDAPALFESMSHMSIEQILALKPMVVKPWDRFVDVYVETAKQIQPDLIISDPVFAAGMIAASLMGIPAIAHGYMLVRFTADILREHAVAFERYGVELPKKTGLIDIGPGSLMEPGPSDWQMRYVPFNGGGVLPAWLAEPVTRPRIAVTLGTPLPHRMGPGRFDSIIAAAREVPDVEFALMVNEATAATLGTLPENVRPTGWIPLYQLAKTCTATINHGGSGTLFTCAVAGLPQLICPDGADNDYNSRIMRSYGAGLVAPPGKVEPGHIHALLSEDGLRVNAEKLRQEIAGMASPADLVDDIVAFATS